MEEEDEEFEDAVEDFDERNISTFSSLHDNTTTISSKNGDQHYDKDNDSQEIHTDVGHGLSLKVGLDEAQMAVDMFLSNKYEEARQISKKHCESSVYHALGFATFYFLKAVMTFDQEYIEVARTVIDQSVNTIDKFRKKSSSFADSIGKIVKKQDYNSFTEPEIHAELVYAECLLLKAVLTVCEDETLVSFVKAGLKVRQCYVSYRECWTIVRERDNSQDSHSNQFENGVRLGVGTFNLLMSLLPPRITKLLQAVGFTTPSKDVGMAQLLKCYQDQTCLRQFLSSIVLLGYHLFVCNHMGQESQSDYRLVNEILTSKLSKYPNGAFFLFFKGRYEFVQGNCGSAAQWYRQANLSQSEWPQFHHIAFWEMIWCAAYQCDWREAVSNSGRLLSESRWSPCIYSYLKAAFYCQIQDTLNSTELTEQKKLMSAVPSLRQKIAGKSLPMEKFAAKKSELFLSGGGKLILAGVELVYLWNGFTVLSKDKKMVEKVYVLVEEEGKKLGGGRKEEFWHDNNCLLLLLRGMCLKHMGSPLAAEECFRIVLSTGRGLTVNKYLLPYSTVELAILLEEQGQLEEAKRLLDTAKQEYKDYSLQNRLHFRIHAAQNRIREEVKKF